MTNEKRIQLNPSKLLGLKHLVPIKGKKIQIARAMVGVAKVGFSRLLN